MKGKQATRRVVLAKKLGSKPYPVKLDKVKLNKAAEKSFFNSKLST